MGHSPHSLLSAIPLSGPSRLLWAPYPSGLKGPRHAIPVTWTTKRGCLGCRGRARGDGQKEGDAKREEGKGGRAGREILLEISQCLYVLNEIKDERGSIDVRTLSAFNIIIVIMSLTKGVNGAYI